MDTPVANIDTETEQALTRFVMECSELTELEALLSRFNIFRQSFIAQMQGAPAGRT